MTASNGGRLQHEQVLTTNRRLRKNNWNAGEYSQPKHRDSYFESDSHSLPWTEIWTRGHHNCEGGGREMHTLVDMEDFWDGKVSVVQDRIVEYDKQDFILLDWFHLVLARL